MQYEKEPTKEPLLQIDIGNKKLFCRPSNTFAYLYENSTFDHLFYMTSQNDDGSLNGYHIWRPMLDSNFDEAIYFMIKNGFEVESLIEPDECDYNTYIEKYGAIPNEPIKPVELTPRQDNRVNYLGWLLCKDLIKPDDFNDKYGVLI